MVDLTTRTKGGGARAYPTLSTLDIPEQRNRAYAYCDLGLGSGTVVVGESDDC